MHLKINFNNGIIFYIEIRMENVQIREKSNSVLEKDHQSDKFEYHIPAEKSTNIGISLDNQGLQLANDNTLHINKSDFTEININDNTPNQINLSHLNKKRMSKLEVKGARNSVKIDQKAQLSSLRSNNPLDYLHLAQKATIRQVVDKKVFMSGCEPPIRYHIEITTYAGEKKKIFKAQEISTWCMKNCLQ